MIIESEWRETDIQCPFCHWNLYSDGNNTDCVTDKCRYHELHLMGLSYDEIVFLTETPYGLTNVIAIFIQEKKMKNSLALLEKTKQDEKV